MIISLSSPTVTAEAVILTCIIDIQKDRDVTVVDIPNAFVQTVVSKEDADHRVIVRIRGPLVDILVSITPGYLWPICFHHQDWAERVDCRMPQCRLWNNGSSTALLQEVCQELCQASSSIRMTGV